MEGSGMDALTPAPTTEAPTLPPTLPPPRQGECGVQQLGSFFGFMSPSTEVPFLFLRRGTTHPNEPMDFDCQTTCPVQKAALQEDATFGVELLHCNSTVPRFLANTT